MRKIWKSRERSTVNCGQQEMKMTQCNERKGEREGEVMDLDPKHTNQVCALICNTVSLLYLTSDVIMKYSCRSDYRDNRCFVSVNSPNNNVVLDLSAHQQYIFLFIFCSAGGLGHFFLMPQTVHFKVNLITPDLFFSFSSFVLVCLLILVVAVYWE